MAATAATGDDYRNATTRAGKEARAAAEQLREVSSKKAKAHHEELAHLHEKAGNNDDSSETVRSKTYSAGKEARAAAEAEREAVTKKNKALHAELGYLHETILEFEKRVAALEKK